MSLFKTIDVNCPACGTSNRFEAVTSVNADRRPDYRDDILASTFQRSPCTQCGQPFRLDPELTYLDIGRGQWIVASPFREMGDWNLLEARARASFDRGYGSGAAPAARALGAQLKPRITFGWAALREKLYAVELGLDDVELELMKMAIFRGSDSVPLTDETELRLLGQDGDALNLCWIVAETQQRIETLSVPRGLYDDIAADHEGWQALRDELSGQCFVDMQRLMLDPAAAEAAAGT